MTYSYDNNQFAYGGYDDSLLQGSYSMGGAKGGEVATEPVTTAAPMTTVSAVRANPLAEHPTTASRLGGLFDFGLAFANSRVNEDAAAADAYYPEPTPAPRSLVTPLNIALVAALGGAAWYLTRK
jgi:hypothetical protein